MALEAARATARRTDPYAATKRAFEGKVRLLAIVLAFVGREGIILAGESVLHMEVVLKSIGPELGREVGASESTAKGVTNSLVSTFNGSILMRGIGTGRLDVVAEFVK
jgi:hypothetical protein